jgi:hypothetical protein
MEWRPSEARPEVRTESDDQQREDRLSQTACKVYGAEQRLTAATNTNSDGNASLMKGLAFNKSA